MITEWRPGDSLPATIRPPRPSRFSRPHVPVRPPGPGLSVPKSILTAKRPDPVYGDAAKVTWEELERPRRGRSGRCRSARADGFPLWNGRAAGLRSALVADTHGRLGSDSPGADCAAFRRVVSARYRVRANGKPGRLDPVALGPVCRGAAVGASPPSRISAGSYRRRQGVAVRAAERWKLPTSRRRESRRTACPPRVPAPDGSAGKGSTRYLSPSGSMRFVLATSLSWIRRAAVCKPERGTPPRPIRLRTWEMQPSWPTAGGRRYASTPV